MKTDLFMQVGWGFLGFSFAQFIAFIGTAYPQTANGAAMFLIVMWFIVFILGATHWVELRQKENYDGEYHWFIGFMPLWILGGFLTIAIIGGLSLGGVK